MGTSHNERIRVAIIGGGFAGLTLLIGLLKYPHIDATLYESSQKFSEQGASAVLGPSAQRAMELIDPRILHGFQNRAAFHEEEPDKNGMHTWVRAVKGQEPDVGGVIAEFKYHIRGSTIHRAHFLEELVKLVPPSQTKFGKKLTDIIQPTGDDNEPMVLHFRDRTFAKADVVVGADGIHSMVRKHILGIHHEAANAFFTGVISYRSTIPYEDAQAVLGDDYVKPEFALRCGKNGLIFGFPMVNKTMFFIGVMTFNNSHDRVTEDLWSIPVDTADLQQRFGDWDPYVQKLVSLVPDDASTTGFSIWEMPLAPTYVKGRVVIIGDAAHAPTPFSGAGAAMAIEDSCVLHTLLGKYLDPERLARNKFSKAQSVRLALQSFDSVRRLRTQKVVVRSAEMGRLLSCTEEGVGSSQAEMYRHLEGKLWWIYDGNQEEQVRDACLLFERAEFAAAQATSR
ncbi:mannitol 1-phosphate dehydrogenase [Grosmannia clavigera kw1407]|uniref:Mannitol 1-phosphate dehydrogenase n=1 Tax=Grosmannia clavigera (strain kw1407 / UAMH 11150) TaxID=655863 RepID=F0XMW1_GROCL|nr:mannitol 1-phosphate dehydrogenase [Grosmannia clavigera kw1407]EFX00868.1 mannitol 1-phosphate dehydrogenase [Grosmannia clavigera kw1407]